MIILESYKILIEDAGKNSLMGLWERNLGKKGRRGSAA